jgi:nucleoside-diphosphate-sugar epimerase
MSIPDPRPAIAITGASGFIGLNVVEQALAAGRRVIAFDLQPLPSAARQAFASLPGQLSEHVGDLTSATDRARFLSEPGIGALIQAAAITPDAARERDAPGSVFAVNTAAALDCIGEAVAHGIPRIIAVSSVSIYGSVPEDLADIPEDTPLNPFNLYGLSKLALERGLARLQELKPFSVTLARLSPQFGRWEWRSGKRDALSALLQCLALARQEREVVLPRDVIIDWLYAADAGRALLILADTTELPFGLCNIGSGQRFLMSQWCMRLAQELPGFRWRVDAAASNVIVNPGFDRPPQNIDRMRSIGWQPSRDLAAALADYTRFIADHPAFAPEQQWPAPA